MGQFRTHFGAGRNTGLAGIRICAFFCSRRRGEDIRHQRQCTLEHQQFRDLAYHFRHIGRRQCNGHHGNRHCKQHGGFPIGQPDPKRKGRRESGNQRHAGGKHTDPVRLAGIAYVRGRRQFSEYHGHLQCQLDGCHFHCMGNGLPGFGQQ